MPDLTSSKINAPVLPGFRDAENILRQVQQNRGYLESNFEAVLRARQEVEVYSMLEAVYNDRYCIADYSQITLALTTSFGQCH